MFYGDVFMDEEESELALDQYQLAYDLVQDDVFYLQMLKARYEEHEFQTELAELEETIAMLEAKLQAEQEALSTKNESVLAE